MRIATLCLGLGVILSASVTVLAQEIIAPEEWFESIKLSRDLATRKLQNSRRVRGHHHHNQARISSGNMRLSKRSIPIPQGKTSSPPRLQKRVKGSPPSSEIETVDALAGLHVVQETAPTVATRAAKDNLKLQRSGKKAAKKTKNKAKKGLNSSKGATGARKSAKKQTAWK
ncbi:hypothetical protein BGZ58_004664 [Dissophora ornata]|nr:hypothetical protein BGZ58_004664 [Dissophora ornata]